MKQKFLVCRHCGKMVAMVKESGVPTICCGEEMRELIPGAVDAAKEKHVPVVTKDGNLVRVKVGDVAHPMTPEHHIAWISVETKYGNQRHELSAGDAPETTFALTEGDEVKAVYAFCNLHGLWVDRVCN